MTAGAYGPAADALGDLGLPAIKPVQASLTNSGTDAVITGSISFTGPNRGAKSDRVRPTPDALAIARSFERARMHIADLRAGDRKSAASPVQVAAIDPVIVAKGEDQPRISIAMLDPAMDSEALAAIAGLAPQADTPLPMQASEQLSYARETAPATGAYGSGTAMAASDKELWCLATAVYFEARGESYRGQVAVAQVVLNRVKDHRYPNTICGVVFQNQSRRNACQFSFACDGQPEVVNDPKSWAQAQEISTKVTDGELYLTEVADATHYHANYVRPAWAPRMQKVTQIGLHIFYKFKRGWLFG